MIQNAKSYTVYQFTYDELITFAKEIMAHCHKEENPEEFLSKKEVLKIFGVADSTLWRWNKTKYLCSIKRGNKLYYKKSEVDAILKYGSLHDI